MLDKLPQRSRNCDARRSQLRRFLVFAALACSVRITSAITWVFLFPPLLSQLSRNRTLLRAFITDAISTAYVYERLLYTLFTHVMFQVCGVLSALHTRQRVQRGANTDSARFSPCQRLVYLTLLWVGTMALLS